MSRSALICFLNSDYVTGVRDYDEVTALPLSWYWSLKRHTWIMLRFYHISLTIVWVVILILLDFIRKFRFVLWGIAMGSSARFCGLWDKDVRNIKGGKISQELFGWWYCHLDSIFQSFWFDLKFAIVRSLTAMASCKFLLTSLIVSNSWANSSHWVVRATFSAHISENLSSFFHLERAADSRFFLRLFNCLKALTSS